MALNDLYRVYVCGAVDGRYVCSGLGYKVISGGIDDPIAQGYDLARKMTLDGWVNDYVAFQPLTYSCHALRAYYMTDGGVGVPCAISPAGNRPGESGTVSDTSGVGYALRMPYKCLKTNTWRTSRFVFPSIPVEQTHQGEVRDDFFPLLQEFAASFLDTVATDSSLYNPGIISEGSSPVIQYPLAAEAIKQVRTNRRRLQDHWQPGRRGRDYLYCVANIRGLGSNLDISSSTLYLPNTLDCTFPSTLPLPGTWQYYVGNVTSTPGVYVTAGLIKWVFPTYTTLTDHFTPTVYWQALTDAQHPAVTATLTSSLILNTFASEAYPGSQVNDVFQMSGNWIATYYSHDTGVTVNNPVAHPI